MRSQARAAEARDTTARVPNEYPHQPYFHRAGGLCGEVGPRSGAIRSLVVDIEQPAPTSTHRDGCRFVAVLGPASTCDRHQCLGDGERRQSGIAGHFHHFGDDLFGGPALQRDEDAFGQCSVRARRRSGSTRGPKELRCVSVMASPSPARDLDRLPCSRAPLVELIPAASAANPVGTCQRAVRCRQPQQAGPRYVAFPTARMHSTDLALTRWGAQIPDVAHRAVVSAVDGSGL